LYQWARWYDSIYKMSPTDKPTDQLIADDQQLDLWFDRFLRDAARKLGRQGGSGDRSLALVSDGGTDGGGSGKKFNVFDP
jgi:hypothetical protein